MKRLFTFLALMGAILVLNAQTRPYPGFTLPRQISISTYSTGFPFPPMEAAQPQAGKITYRTLGKKWERVVVKAFTNEGQPISQYYNTKKGNMLPGFNVEYTESGKFKKAEYFKKGKLHGSSTYEYDINGNALSQIKLDKKGRQTQKELREYNDEGCLAAIKYYNDHKCDEPTFTWVYEYHDNCELSSTKHYDKKGKLRSQWDYDCDQEGEISKTNDISETKFCQWQEAEGEFLIEIKETTSPKGEKRRAVLKYTLPDTLLVESKSFDTKGTLRYHMTYNGSRSQILTQRSLNKRGKIRYVMDATYDDKRRLVKSTSSWKGKSNPTYEYEYNDQDLITAVKRFSEGELRRTTTVEYEL